MAIIYRIEDDDGYGPYNASIKKYGAFKAVAYDADTIFKLKRRHNNSDGRPTVTEDTWHDYEQFFNIRNHSLKYSCGFCSMKQLMLWFSEKKVLDFFHDNGFLISAYECEEKNFALSDKQVIFLKDFSVLKTRFRHENHHKNLINEISTE